MHGRKDVARPHAIVQRHAHHHSALHVFDPRQAAIDNATRVRVARVHGKRRRGGTGHQIRHTACAGHGVPLVAHPTGIEGQREFLACSIGAGRKRNHACPAVRGRKAATGEQPGARRSAPGPGQGPLHRRQMVVSRIIQFGQCTQVEHSRAIILECRQGRVFAEDVGGSSIRESRRPSPCACRLARTSTSRGAPGQVPSGRRADGRCGVRNW